MLGNSRAPGCPRHPQLPAALPRPGHSSFGDRLAPIAITFAVFDLTKSTSEAAYDLGFVFAAQTAPMFLLVAAAGGGGGRPPRQPVVRGSGGGRRAAPGATAAPRPPPPAP